MNIVEVMTGRTVSRSTRKALRRKREAQRQPVVDDPWLMGDEAWHHGQDESANPFQMGTVEFED